MKRSRILFFFSGLIFLMLCLGSCSEPSSKKEQGRSIPPPGEGIKAPDFKLPDLEGSSFRLSQAQGKPVLLIFSTTWCAYCRSELPHLREIHGRYNPHGLEVVQIFIQESRQKVSSFASQYHLSYRVLLDEKGEAAEMYGVRGVPDMILLDRDGRLICRRCPDLDGTLKDLFAKAQGN